MLWDKNKKLILRNFFLLGFIFPLFVLLKNKKIDIKHKVTKKRTGILRKRHKEKIPHTPIKYL